MLQGSKLLVKGTNQVVMIHLYMNKPVRPQLISSETSSNYWETDRFESDGFANTAKPVIVNGRGQDSPTVQGTEQLSPPLQNLQ